MWKITDTTLLQQNAQPIYFDDTSIQNNDHDSISVEYDLTSDTEILMEDNILSSNAIGYTMNEDEIQPMSIEVDN